MNDDQLDALFNLARSATPDTSRVEYGFETRLLARIREERSRSGLLFGWSWKLCPYFAGIVAALAVWTYVSPPQIDLQAASKGDEDDLRIVEYLTGDKI